MEFYVRTSALQPLLLTQLCKLMQKREELEVAQVVHAIEPIVADVVPQLFVEP